MAARITTPVARSCYRLANLLVVADRMTRRSKGRGVKLIVDGGDLGILLVRHTYGRRHWTLPGGRVGRGEATASAARRELAEELAVEDADLTPIGSYPAKLRRRSEVIEVFLVNPQEGELRANPVEIAESRWFGNGTLPPDLDPLVETALGLLAGHRAEAAVAERDRHS